MHLPLDINFHETKVYYGNWIISQWIDRSSWS